MVGQAFAGKYVLESAENVDEFLKAIGVNPMVRAHAQGAKAHVEVAIKDDEWTLKIHWGLRDMEFHLKMDVEQDVTTPDGRRVKVICHLEGESKLVQKDRWDDKEVVTVHELNGDEWTMTQTYGGVKCIRHFKRE